MDQNLIRPSAYYFHDLKLVAFLMRKNASSSLREALRHQGLQKFHTHLKTKVLDLQRDGYEVIAIVRDPLDRLISAWRYFYNRAPKDIPDTSLSLDDWLIEVCNMDPKHMNEHIQHQSFLLSDLNGNIIPDRLIRFENLKEDWKDFQRDYPKIPDLNHKGKSNREGDEPSLEVMNKVYEFFSDDYEKLGYKQYAFSKKYSGSAKSPKEIQF